MKEIYYKPVKAICQDKVIRTVYVRSLIYDGSFYADTWFSVPARCKVKGKTVAGYISTTDNELCEYEFRAYLYRKNHNVF